MKKQATPTKEQAQVRLLNAIKLNDAFKLAHPEKILDHSLWAEHDNVITEWLKAFNLAEMVGMTQEEQHTIMKLARV